MAGELGKNLSLPDFIEIVALVMEKHRWPLQGHGIKYIRSSFDTRSGDIFGVTLEGIRGMKRLVVVNENKDRDLRQWILEFLDSDPDKETWEQL